MPMKIESRPQYDEICKHLVSGKITQTELAFRYNVPRTAITRLKKKLAAEVAERRRAEVAAIRKEKAAARSPRRPLRKVWEFFFDRDTAPGRAYKLLEVEGPGGPERVMIHRGVHEEISKYRWKKILLRHDAAFVDPLNGTKFKEICLWTEKGPDGRGWRAEDLIEAILLDRGQEPTTREIQMPDPFHQEEQNIMITASEVSHYNAAMAAYRRIPKFTRQLWRIKKPKDPRINRRR